ncbi:MAG: hemerythrin cation-binding protein [Frankiales bacterium]|nr:hemerythrin cation-binding protein [Frankiales bacterium]
MCEYCGCQAIRSLDELTREHDAALDEIRAGREAAATGDHQAAVRVALRLLELLGPHTAVEEQALFPAMAREHPAHVAVLAQEHGQIHLALTDTAAGRSDGPPWRPSLTAALDVLREHIIKEQDGLFPAALAALSTGEWEAVEHVRSRVGTALRPVP